MNFISTLDAVVKRDLLSPTASLKVFMGFASIPTALLLIAVSILHASSYQLSVVCFTLADAFIASCEPSISVNPLFLSKNFSGMLYGVANTFGTIGTGSMLLLLAVFKETVADGAHQYQYTMLSTGCLLLINYVLYVVWAEGVVQDFDDEAEKGYQALQVKP